MINQRLSERVNRMEESATIKMTQLARDLAEQGHDVIKLSIGEPDFDTPDHIKEAAKAALDRGDTKYTPVPGTLALRRAIAAKFERDNNLAFSEKQIAVSNGAKQCIANVALALLQTGDEAILFTPYWVSYLEIVKLTGATPVEVKAGIEADFKVGPELLRECLTSKTRLLIFSSPCNPTGSVYSSDDLRNLVHVLRDFPEVIILSDEIYEYINFSESHVSIGAFDEVRDRVVTVNGFSKGFSMTGWRLGYMGGPQWIINACNKIQGQFTSGAAAFNQAAATVALQSSLEPTHQMREAFLKRRNMFLDLLREIKGFSVNSPMGAFYVFPDISHFFGMKYKDQIIGNSDDFANFILREAHVAIVSGKAFGADECVRLSYAASQDSLREAVKRIKAAVDKLG